MAWKQDRLCGIIRFNSIRKGFIRLVRIIFLELNAKHVHAPKIALKDVDN